MTTKRHLQNIFRFFFLLTRVLTAADYTQTCLSIVGILVHFRKPLTGFDSDVINNLWKVSREMEQREGRQAELSKADTRIRASVSGEVSFLRSS